MSVKFVTMPSVKSNLFLQGCFIVDQNSVDYSQFEIMIATYCNVTTFTSFIIMIHVFVVVVFFVCVVCSNIGIKYDFPFINIR